MWFKCHHETFGSNSLCHEYRVATNISTKVITDHSGPDKLMKNRYFSFRKLTIKVERPAYILVISVVKHEPVTTSFYTHVSFVYYAGARLVQFSQVSERVVKVAVHSAIVGVDGKGLAIAGNSFFHLAKFLERTAQVIVRLGVIGLDGKRFSVACYGIL